MTPPSALPLSIRLKNALEGLRGVLRPLGAALLLALAMRFTWAVSNDPSAPALAPDPPARPVTSAATLPPAPTVAKSARAAPPVIIRGEPTRLGLSISAGEPRSEVFVNGVRRGHTPFLGDVSCKIGEPLMIQVIPKKGALLVFERICRPGTLSLSKPDEP